jgi:phosphatidylserine decarboxylase
MFAREGYPFIIGSAMLSLSAFALAFRLRSWPVWLLALLMTIITVWVCWFFRDPVRTGTRGADVVIAPADGKVVLISRLDEPSFVRGPTVRVSIFMNVFDVHVNRYPLSGTVAFVERKAGKFLNAITEASSAENEQASVGLTVGAHRILVRQIAGLIARRIITDPAVGAVAQQGDRFGLIRFGSRVDVFLPPDSELTVHLGQRTVAGSTVIARLPRT